jgi:hypothetical protein
MYKGIQYPSSTSKKLYRKVRKTLHIDSRDRNPLQTQSKYTVTLPNVYENVYSISLKSMELPYSWYLFSTENNNLSFTLHDLAISPNMFTITIPAGNYTDITLPLAIKTALNAATSTSNYNVQHNATTNKLTFTNSANGFMFHFSGVESTSTSYWGLGYYMGFSKKDYTATGSGPFTLDSEFAIQLSGPNYVLMELDYLNKQDECSIDTRLSGRTDGCFAKIPITGNAADIIFFKENAFYPLNRSIQSPPVSQLKSLSVKFRNHDGTLINFNNVDHSFTLELELIDNNFDEFSSMEFTPL